MSSIDSQLLFDEAVTLSSVKVHTDSDKIFQDKNRLETSDGTCRAQDVRLANAYVNFAYVPRPPWSPAYSSELLLADGLKCGGDAVTVFEVFEGAIADRLRESIVSAISRNDGPAISENRAIIFAGIGRKLTYEGDVSFHGFTIDTPNLTTVSIDPTANAFVGIHVDSWGQKPLSARSSCPVRVCLNLGPEDRFLLFSCWTVGAIAGAVANLPARPVEANVNSLLAMFLARHPWLPIVKLRIRPGEAYIAPVENLPHDGCSLEQRMGAMHTAFRGNFAPLPAVVQKIGQPDCGPQARSWLAGRES